jgi:hypothetical protein
VNRSTPTSSDSTTAAVRPALRGAWLAVLIATACASVAASAQTAPADPRQINVIQAPIANVVVPQQSTTAPLRAGVWLDRPGGLYSPGDKVKIFLRLNFDAYVAVVNVNADGQTLALFPNQFVTSNLVKGNTVVQLPGQGYDLSISPPYGANLVKVIASTSPISFAVAAGATPDRVAADINRQINLVAQQAPQAQFATAQVVMGVVPRSGDQTVVVNVPPVAPPVAPPVTPPTPTPPPAWTLPALSSAFGLSVRTGTDKYAAGAPMSLQVTPEKSCTLSLISYDPNGVVSVLYPNSIVKSTRLTKGSTTFLPTAGARERLTASGTPGVHTLVAICSEDAGFFSNIFRSGGSDRATVEVQTPANVDALLTGSGRVARSSVTYTVTAP